MNLDDFDVGYRIRPVALHVRHDRAPSRTGAGATPQVQDDSTHRTPMDAPVNDLVVSHSYRRTDDSGAHHRMHRYSLGAHARNVDPNRPIDSDRCATDDRRPQP